MLSEEAIYQEPTTSIVILEQSQYQMLVDISHRADLLANRIDVLLLIMIVLLTLFMFGLMRSRR